MSSSVPLEPGVLSFYKIYNGYWFFGRPTMENIRQDLCAVTAMVQTHQPGQAAFRSVLPEDIEGDIE